MRLRQVDGSHVWAPDASYSVGCGGPAGGRWPVDSVACPSVRGSSAADLLFKPPCARSLFIPFFFFGNLPCQTSSHWSVNTTQRRAERQEATNLIHNCPPNANSSSSPSATLDATPSLSLALSLPCLGQFRFDPAPEQEVGNWGALPASSSGEDTRKESPISAFFDPVVALACGGCLSLSSTAP